MSKNLNKCILNQLVDRYEHSNKELGRRVIINTSKFRNYDLSDPIAKKAFHQSVFELESLGYITYEWERFEKGNLLMRLILNTENMVNVYAYLNRIPKDKQCSIYEKEMTSWMQQFKSHWILTFIEDVITELNEKECLSSKLSAVYEERQEFFRILRAIDQGVEMSARYLSAKLFGDSKTFEKVHRGKLISIAKRYLQLDLEKDQILEYLGIMQNPEEILFRGKIIYQLDNAYIDSSDYRYGNSLNMATVKNMAIKEVQCHRVLTIENKATYYEYIKKASTYELVIYLGGFFGNTTRLFLNKLKECLPSTVEFYHWSDIDLGGLQIFKYLCEVLNTQVHPFNMDAQTYLQNYSKESVLTKTQLKGISDLKACGWLRCLSDTIDVMIEKQCRLEQERVEI